MRVLKAIRSPLHWIVHRTEWPPCPPGRCLRAWIRDSVGDLILRLVLFWAHPQARALGRILDGYYFMWDDWIEPVGYGWPPDPEFRRALRVRDWVPALYRLEY